MSVFTVYNRHGRRMDDFADEQVAVTRLGEWSDAALIYRDGHFFKQKRVAGMNTFGCVGNTIRLRSGLYLDLADPKPEQFTFADIAGALAKICRFGGQVEKFYSVAEHCYWCAVTAAEDLLPFDTQAAVLLHDAAEAFIGDVVKPLKIMLPSYDVIESRMETAIAEKFSIDFAKHRDAVREIDHAMLIAERRHLFSADNVTWSGENECRQLRIPLAGMAPWEAEEMFVVRARLIGIRV